MCVTEQSEPDVGACCLWQNVHKPGSQGCFVEPHHHCASSSHLTWTTESGSPEGGPLSPVCSPAKAQTCTVRCVFLLGSQTFVVTWNCATSLPLPSEDFWQFLNFYHFCILHKDWGGGVGGVGVTRDPVKLSQRLIPGQDKGCATVLSWHFLKPPLVAVQTKNTLNIFLFYLFILNPSTISWDCY